MSLIKTADLGRGRTLEKNTSFAPVQREMPIFGATFAHAWNWTQEYPDQGFSVDSIMLQNDERDAVVKSGIPAWQVPPLHGAPVVHPLPSLHEFVLLV